MREGTVVIRLTPAQVVMLHPLRQQLQKAFDDGKPTMLVGQVDSAIREVMFAVLSHEEAVQVLLVTHPEHAEAIRRGDFPVEV